MFVLFSFPENHITENDPLNVIDVDCAAPAAELIHGTVFIGSGQGPAGGKLRSIGENDLCLNTDLILQNAPRRIGGLVFSRFVEVGRTLLVHPPYGAERR